jgi:hypothetical protein
VVRGLGNNSMNIKKIDIPKSLLLNKDKQYLYYSKNYCAYFDHEGTILQIVPRKFILERLPSEDQLED